jgi:hypothetical protein
MADFSKYIDSSAPIGVPIRIHRYCPLHEGRTSGFVVIPDRKGYLLFCHKCGKKKWIPRRGFSPRAVRALLNTPRTKVYQDISLPSDMSYKIPAKGLVWLYEYGLTDKLIRELGFGYSEKYQRLIMPVYEDDDLVHWSGRYLGDHKKDDTSKYILRTKSGKYFWSYNPHDSNRAVLVEDMLSAIKVGLAGYAGVCLFGSYLKDQTIDNVADQYDRLTVWLDPDKRKDATKYTKRFSSLGYDFNAVLTAKKDPKEYTIKEIKKFLK